MKWSRRSTVDGRPEGDRRPAADGAPAALQPEPRPGGGAPAGYADVLTADDVHQFYSDLLGRTPSDAEIAHQLANASGLRELLRVLLGSAEYRVNRAAPAPPHKMPAVVNTWHENLALYAHRPGTWSEDGVAVVGHEGWIFLGTGTNAVLNQYREGYTLPGGWGEDWSRAVQTRRSAAAELGAAYVGVVVPDKIAVLAQHVPEELPAGVRPPAVLLAQTSGLGVLYPAAELAAVPGGAYLRTDSHLTYAGNAALARVVLEALGVPPEYADTDVEALSYATSGDLGDRFLPPIVEIVTVPHTYGRAVVVEDNTKEILGAGAHIGTRRVLRNEQALDPRTVVLFGDSYGHPATHYQGLGWFLAQAFREVHSAWVPFGFDRGYAERAGAQVIVCEAAERFVVRPPEPEVDVLELGERAMARARG